jgi:hypothetical protein
MRVLAKRTLSGFTPTDDASVKEFGRVPLGRVAYVEIITARNPKQHRLMFALLGLLVENGYFPTTDAALTAVKIATGHVVPFIDPEDGKTFFTVKSISFANMTQGAFEEFFNAALKAVAAKWLDGVTDIQLRMICEERA